MNCNKKYCSFDKYSIIYNVDSYAFDVLHDGIPILADIVFEGVYKDGKKEKELKDFPFSEYTNSFLNNEDYSYLCIKFREQEECDSADVVLWLLVGVDNVCVKFESKNYYCIKLCGKVCSEAENSDDVFAVCLERPARDFRCAIGSAVSPEDHAVYNRMTDSAVVVDRPHKTKLQFEETEGSYKFELFVSRDGDHCTGEFSFRENIIAERYNIKFSPRNRNSTFPLPPVGWMTWYAVKFDACEENVLRNAKWQAENLRDFGANTVWVDWEWFHNTYYSIDGRERTDGVCSLNPDLEKYPHGLKYVADEIKKMGLIPSLWISFLNEPGKNEFIEKYPDILVADFLSWCGRYWYDPTNPHYLDEYLPAAVQTVHNWGYEAVKFDTIPVTMEVLEQHHFNMYDPMITTKEAIRGVMKKTRELLGEDMYMLSCAGVFTGDVLWSSDIFDAARIGEDIFTWEEYTKNIKRLQIFYGIHNIQLYNDPDNVVLRDEHSNFEQAKSRMVLHSLLGLPITFGDEFSALTDEKINLIKRSLPVMDTHPADLFKMDFDIDCFPLNLEIAKPYENYQVTAVFNSTNETVSRTFNLFEDFHLESGRYLVYDFYRNKFLGQIERDLCLELEPYEVRVLSIRPCKDIPQIISTSRHITQGAAEIRGMHFEERRLTLKSSLVAKDVYTVTIYVPDGYDVEEYKGFDSIEKSGNLVQLSFLPDDTADYDFFVSFKMI